MPSREPVSLGDALSAIASDLHIQPITPEDVTLDDLLTVQQRLDWLMTLPSTALLQDAADRADAAIALADEHDAPAAARRLLATARTRASFDLRWGYARDRLSFERPKGCWCFGLGGRGKLYAADVLPEDPWELDAAGVRHPIHVSIFRTYCLCDAGHRVKSEHDALVRNRALRHAQLRLDRQWNNASIPAKYRAASFENALVTERTAILRDAIRDWTHSDVPWLLLSGPTGVGKTWMAAAAARSLSDQNAGAVVMVMVPDLLASVRATFSANATTTEEQLFASLMSADVLVLDDLGAERIVRRDGETPWVEEFLFRVIDKRASVQNGRTIITSNHDLATIQARLGDRTYYRILEQVDRPDGSSGVVVFPDDAPNLRDPQTRYEIESSA